MADTKLRLAANDGVRGVDGGRIPPDDPPMEERITKIEAALPTLATKDDVKQFATKTDFESFRSEFRALIAEAKSDIVKWGSTIVFSATAIIIAVLGVWFTLALRSISPAPVPQDRGPVTINIPATQVQPAPPTQKK